MSCMSLKTFDSLKLNLTKERFPLVITATGTSGKELLKIPANQAKFAQFAQLHRELREFRVFRTKLIHIQFTNFRSLTINREPRKIGANQPDFTQFAHNSRGSREIR